MTKVFVKKNKGIIQYIEVYDHANFDEIGQDIVCSAISSIVFGSLNAFVKYNLKEENIVIEEAFIRIEINNLNNLQIIADTMLVQLETIQEAYPDYIKIEIN
ncbi:ribosomal-processing cysteine protease Prp [Erysipelotrichaceae bacterium OttesenSCG-928-M19]|nr:ribosomal-processing cysteine protease Prp [Erysipelotrichaceae bacterium OttesenSCG-928-M19]